MYTLQVAIPIHKFVIIWRAPEFTVGRVADCMYITCDRAADCVRHM